MDRRSNVDKFLYNTSILIIQSEPEPTNFSSFVSVRQLLIFNTSLEEGTCEILLRLTCAYLTCVTCHRIIKELNVK